MKAYYVVIILKVVLLLFFSYDFIFLKNEDNIIKGKGSSFLKSSYELLFVQKDVLLPHIKKNNQISIFLCRS
ncbi:hypothetical protein PFNF54_02625 [Plasmodium falciparum NF54]|nr:hypothetical protein PFNF54_02625 [Plasmodium falciparum NF54]